MRDRSRIRSVPTLAQPCTGGPVAQRLAVPLALLALVAILLLVAAVEFDQHFGVVGARASRPPWPGCGRDARALRTCNLMRTSGKLY